MKTVTERTLLRAAQSFPNGTATLEFLKQDAQVTLMVDATRFGFPALYGVIDVLSPVCGDDLANPAFRQFVGAVVRYVMSQHGYRPTKSSKMPKGPWQTALCYEKNVVDDSLLRRFVGALTPQERTILIDILGEKP